MKSKDDPSLESRFSRNDIENSNIFIKIKSGLKIEVNRDNNDQAVFYDHSWTGAKQGNDGYPFTDNQSRYFIHGG